MFTDKAIVGLYPTGGSQFSSIKRFRVMQMANGVEAIAPLHHLKANDAVDWAQSSLIDPAHDLRWELSGLSSPLLLDSKVENPIITQRRWARVRCWLS